MTKPAAGPGEFTITLVDEVNPTIDGRIFEPGTVTWREPPLPLMYLTENMGQGEGHKGSKVGGSIQEIWREDDKIKARGTFSTGEEGQEFRRLVSEGLLNGVSADVGGAIIEQELAEDGTAQSRIVQGKIMGATVLPFQAFDDTRIAVVASAVPAQPPAEWFANPSLDGPTPLTITKDGHVFGHAATWGTCHVGKPGQCLTPPRSNSGYAYFKTGSVLTADGSSVATGPITLGTGHAGLSLNSQQTAEHYDHTGAGIADVVAGEDSYGIWIAGAIRPDVPDTRLRTLRASALSGDWRSVGGKLELIALLAVNTPGFPIPRARASFADESDALSLVAAGVIAETDTQEEFSMDTKMGKGGQMSKDPNTDHNDPTDQDNETDETPHNAPDDQDSEPISEAAASKHRKNAHEFSADDEESTEEELSDEEVTELTIRVTQLERALVALASGKLAEFASSVPVVELAPMADDDDEDKNKGEED
jgi:hypothetical protein